MLALFAAAIFLAASLLFLVQPMAAKLILPLLGGSPAVWNASMLFFQAALLGGYAWAHAIGKLRSLTTAAAVHGSLLALAALTLPIGLSATAAERLPGAPVWACLLLLASAVGAPFFALASAGPLLQRWFARSGHRAAADPYFLYAASNAGSMLALLAYPLLVEPALTLRQQTTAWSIGFGLFAVLAVVCALVAGRAGRSPGTAAEAAASTPTTSTAGPDLTPPTLRRRLHWVLLAFLPSSLMLGCTQYMTSDIGSVPLLWVIPLAVYLLSFILAFAAGRTGPISTAISSRLLLPASALVAALFIYDSRQPIGLIILVHLLTLLLAATACHGRLARLRPHPQHLTGFYLLLSVGGVLGGAFNTLLAPLLFSTVKEYPLILLASVALAGHALSRARATPPDDAPPSSAFATAKLVGYALTLVLPVATVGVYLWATAPGGRSADDLLMPQLLAIGGLFAFTASFLSPTLKALGVTGAALVIAGASVLLKWTDAEALAWLAPLALALGATAHLGRFVLCLAAMITLPLLLSGGSARLLLTDRTFFGVHRVFADPDGSSVWHQLWHGRTLHGKQYQQSPWSLMPTTYYHRAGPVGDVFTALHTAGSSRPDATTITAGFVGLGTGTLAAYGRANDRFTFYEIDPTVVTIARDSGLFSFIKDSPADLRFVIGDARITLRQAEPGGYDLLLLDAFSSDAIPVHLVTREAFTSYLRTLAPRGILLVHISNHYVDLEPVVAALADDLGLAVRIRSDNDGEASDEDVRTGHYASTWMALAATTDALALLTDTGKWTEPERRPGLRVWTDDYADLPSVFKWGNAFRFK